MNLDSSQIDAWKDCYKVLKEQLAIFNERYPNFSIVFEYALPYESGRRPDVLLVCKEYVLTLEFKRKNQVLRADVDQVCSYCRDLVEYHYETREKEVIPFLVLTRREDLLQTVDTVNVCSGDRLFDALDKAITRDQTTKTDILAWISSKYEPLPTIVEAARLIFTKEELPNIRRVNSTCIPQAIDTLEKITQYAESNKKYMIVFVTGVPGAGKTFLGLQFVYNVCKQNNRVNSVYLSGNGPLVQVLNDALHSKVFVKDLHNVITEYVNNGATDFSNNIIVFDEGQRAWDIERMKKANRGNNSEPDVMIQLAEERLEWSVLLVLVGEGQEINKGENAGIEQWNTALSKAKKRWEVVCPDKLKHFFADDQKVLKSKNQNSFDPTTSLRSHLAGDVSNLANSIISGDIEEAKVIAESVKKAGFTMLITRDLGKAKNYCLTRYYNQPSKRYGLISSSKCDSFMRKFGVDNSFFATSLRYMNIEKWFNTDASSGVSCCNLEKVVTEFGCQGLELDMPIICWAPDMKWNGTSWNLYKPNLPYEDENNVYRFNSYRVLLTRGRDGFVIYVPNDGSLDNVYQLLKDIGIDELNEVVL